MVIKRGTRMLLASSVRLKTRGQTLGQGKMPKSIVRTQRITTTPALGEGLAAASAIAQVELPLCDSRSCGYSKCFGG